MSYQKHVVIVGSARSGTSWLSETIAQQYRYRLLFEPEHDTLTKDGKLICDRFFTEKDNNNEANSYLKKVFANRVDNDWIAQSSNRKFKRHLWPIIPKKYIIKFVRCNLSAKYINEHFNMPLIHLVRNPYDVINSQQRVKFPWLFNLEHFKKQENLVALINENFGFDLNAKNNLEQVEILTLRWCIENMIPLNVQEPRKYKTQLIKHEDLRKDVNQFVDLCKNFDLEPVKNINKAYKRPSTKAHPNSSVRVDKQMQKKLDRDNLQKINAILDKFNFELYERRG